MDAGRAGGGVAAGPAQPLRAPFSPATSPGSRLFRERRRGGEGQGRGGPPALPRPQSGTLRAGAWGLVSGSGDISLITKLSTAQGRGVTPFLDPTQFSPRPLPARTSGTLGSAAFRCCDTPLGS